MHIHILGICGTFMAGIATLARELGYQVSGADANVYPPMSDYLRASNIELVEGWSPSAIPAHTDQVIIGNALSRGNESVESVLEQGMPYTSGPAWLAEHVLASRHVIAVAGTHGKTTTTSIVAWLLEHCGQQPGFLIGGIPVNFGVPARLGSGRCFVVEADEYDTAFFDKRSKFLHYRPRTAILNNLEFDHADIFANLDAIKLQFHHLIRTIPAGGKIIWNQDDDNLATTLERGCWSRTTTFGHGENAQWRVATALTGEASTLTLSSPDRTLLNLNTPLAGDHNALNVAAAFAAASDIGCLHSQLATGLQSFSGVKRRLEEIGRANGVVVYDDFAHHPTAITATLGGLRQRVGAEQIIAVLEPRSNTMRLGVHRDELAAALATADFSVVYAPPNLGWDTAPLASALGTGGAVYSAIDDVLLAIVAAAKSPSHVLIMSNGSFGGIHQQLLIRLTDRG